MANSIFSVIGTQTKLLVGERLNLAGGTMTGALILSGAPSQTNEAATKGYIDTAIATLTQYARLDGADFTGDVTGTNLNLSGNLTVSGTITAIETNNTTITDSIISLSKGTSGSANASNDSGILIERGSSENNAAMFWDEGDDAFKFATTSSDATATDLGGTSAVADVVVAGVKTNGNDLGTLEQFYAGLALSSGTATIPTSEFDAVAIGGIVSIVGVTSPFSTATLAMSYSTAEEIFYDLKEVSNDGSGNTIVSLELTSISEAGLTDFRGVGTITVNGEVISFS